MGEIVRNNGHPIDYPLFRIIEYNKLFDYSKAIIGDCVWKRFS